MEMFWITSSGISLQVDKLKTELRAIASRDVSTGSQNDVAALVRTVAAELDVYVNARFTKVSTVTI